jgi:hypothetical protein
MFKNLKMRRRFGWILLSLFMAVILIGYLWSASEVMEPLRYLLVGQQLTMDGQNPPTFMISNVDAEFIVVEEVLPETAAATARKTSWSVRNPPRKITYGAAGEPLFGLNIEPLVEGKIYSAYVKSHESGDGFRFIIKDGKAVEGEQA